MVRKILLVIGIATSGLYAHGLATHCYVASQTFEVWKNYDSNFYNDITANHFTGFLTRKFYYIGLMLPDMIDINFQKGIQSLVTYIYDSLPREMDETIEYEISKNLFGVHININIDITAKIKLKEGATLKIRDDAYNQVQQLMYFNGNSPNTNPEKLYEMVKYAKSQGWSSSEKALIYGAYMHVVHDMYAHMVLEPAAFGFPYSVEHDSAVGRDLLYFPEWYYELFTETYITDWDFIDELFMLSGQYTQDGKNYYHYYTFTWNGWDYYYTDPLVQKFIEAAQAVNYTGSGLTKERLEAYIDGWGILFYLTYGYNGFCCDKGGIFGHPSWNPKQILQFIARGLINEYDVTIESVEGDPGGNDIGDILVDIFIDAATFLGITDILIDKYMEEVRNWLLDNPMILVQRIGHLAIGSVYFDTWSWTDFFAGSQGFDKAIGMAWPNYTNDSIATRDMKALRAELGMWEDYYTGDYPICRREFYENEPDRIIGFKELYKASIEQGPDYLDYSPWAISRKAGVLGGMWNPPSMDYYHQPGVLDLHFNFNNSSVYTTTDVSEEGSSQPIDLQYDLVTFGSSETRIYGKNSSGTKTKLAYTEHSDTARYQGELTVSGKDIINQGIVELSFESHTRHLWTSSSFAQMFSSDYRDVYNANRDIYANNFYTTYFVNGNPVRSSGQSPLGDPKTYWPYVLPLNPVVTELNTPSNLSATAASNLDTVKLTWTDNSNYNTHYEIWRRAQGESDSSKIATINESIIPWDKWTTIITVQNLIFDSSSSEPTSSPKGYKVRIGQVGSKEFTTFKAKELKYFPAKSDSAILVLSGVNPPLANQEYQGSYQVTWQAMGSKIINTMGAGIIKITSVGGSKSYTDKNVGPFTDYYYYIRAKKSDIYSDFTYLWNTTSPTFSSGNFAHPTAYNNSSKMIVTGDISDPILHAVYLGSETSGDDGPCYITSPDLGYSWSNPLVLAKSLETYTEVTLAQDNNTLIAAWVRSYNNEYYSLVEYAYLDPSLDDWSGPYSLFNSYKWDGEKGNLVEGISIVVTEAGTIDLIGKRRSDGNLLHVRQLPLGTNWDTWSEREERTYETTTRIDESSYPSIVYLRDTLYAFFTSSEWLAWAKCDVTTGNWVYDYISYEDSYLDAYTATAHSDGTYIYVVYVNHNDYEIHLLDYRPGSAWGNKFNNYLVTGLATQEVWEVYPVIRSIGSDFTIVLWSDKYSHSGVLNIYGRMWNSGSWEEKKLLSDGYTYATSFVNAIGYSYCEDPEICAHYLTSSVLHNYLSLIYSGGQVISKTLETGDLIASTAGGPLGKGDNISLTYALQGVLPNPVTRGGEIVYSLAGKVPVKLTVYDISGRLVKEFKEGVKEPGIYRVKFDGRDNQDRNLSQGVYFVRLAAGDFKATKKLILMR